MLHRNRSEAHVIREIFSVTSLQSATDLHHVMRQYRTIEAAQTILANKMPTDSHLEF